MTFKLVTSLSALVLLAVHPAYSDVVEGADATWYGWVVAISESSVRLGENCTETSTRELPLRSIQSIQFSDQCRKPPYDMASSGATAALACTKKKMVRVIFNSSPEVVANVVSFDRKTKSLVIASVKSGLLQGPITDIALIRWDELCESDIAKLKPVLPPGFKSAK